MPRKVGLVPRVDGKVGLMPGWLVGVGRAGRGLLCVAALVGSLCVVAVSPVGGVEGVADAADSYNEACSGAAAADAGFGDVSSGHAHGAAIDCLAHYGITLGTSEGVFSPGASVTRRQMALFMVRAAGVAGVVFDDAVDQGFTDVGSEGEAVRDAIDRVAAAGILTGVDGLFRPGDAVTRGEMAVAVINLLALDGVSDFVGRATSTAIAIRAANSSGTGLVAVRVDDAFADVTLNEPRAVDDAVSRLFELGIAKGTSEGVFSPDAEVTRGQMAAFITRALAFTSARPVGVSIAPGAVAGMYDVSVRDADFGPVINARVDFFYVSGDVSGALNADGTCDTDVVESDGDDPARECVIDAVDLTTDGRGDATIDISGVTPTADSPLTVWAWTGDIGDEVQQGTQIASYVATADAAGPEAFTVKRSTPTRFARMGSEVTVTIQLVDSGTGLNDVARAGYNFNIGIEAWKDTRDDTQLNPGSTGTRVTFDPDLIGENAVDNTNIGLQARRVVSVTTDESGRATFTVGGARDSAVDPDPNRNSRDTLVIWNIQPAPPPAGASAVTAAGDADHNQQDVVFADCCFGVFDDTVPRSGTRAVSSIIGEPATPFNRVGDNVTAYIDVTVHDAYGNPIAGQALQLSNPSSSLTADSSLVLGTGAAANRYTSRSGAVRLSYARDGGDPVQGTIRVSRANEEGAIITGGQSEPITVLWVDDPDDSDAAASQSAYNILAVDAASNEIVVDSDTTNTAAVPWVLTFDSDDRFIGLEGPTDMAGFVKAITDDLQDGSPSLTLEWDFRSATKNTAVLWTLDQP